jgi:tryptophan 2,3-dioxygenase
LERTPGLEADGFNFWGKYKQAVETLLAKQRRAAEVRTNHKYKYVGDWARQKV